MTQPRVTRRQEILRVDRNIVNLLSRATYESFPRVLRELVSNAYDADATRVSIEIDLQNDLIVVEDNGNGMTPEQFSYFLTIAATGRDPLPTPRYKRERIGQFGVGFLAAFPFCEELTVETSASGSSSVITASLPSNRYLRERPQEREAIEEIGIPVVETDDPRVVERHFARLTLKGLTELARQYLEVPAPSKGRSPIDQLKWDLQDTLILDYPDDRDELAKAVKQIPVGMEVYLNGDRLFRNPPPGEVMATHSDEPEQIAGLIVRYIITSPWEPVHPVDLRGLRIRVSNVGVGRRETFGLAVQAGALPRLTWLSGDIYIDKGAREFLALDREGFTNTPALEALWDHFRGVLRKVEHQLTGMDTHLKAIEAGVGLPVRGGGPRPKLPVGSRRELIEQHIADLTDEGFTVERIPSREPKPARKARVAGSEAEGGGRGRKDSGSPVKIDRTARKITVYEGHPALSDTLHVGGKDYKLAFERWSFRDSPWPACRIEDAQITVNEEYPLFTSKSHGQLFLRLAASVVLSVGSEPDQAIARQLLVSWVDEFADLL